MQIVIDIPEKMYKDIQRKSLEIQIDGDTLENAVLNGTPLPKGHGDLIDKKYLLSVLQCEEYETCTWKNCSDCNREKCIKRYTVLDAPTIIEADREESEETK